MLGVLQSRRIRQVRSKRSWRRLGGSGWAAADSHTLIPQGGLGRMASAFSRLGQMVQPARATLLHLDRNSSCFKPQICVKHKSMPKRRKRGRPATGHDPILGVRVPVKVIRKIDLLGEALSMDRSATVRRLIERGLAYDSYLLRTTKGKGATGEVINIFAELEKAWAAEAAAKRARRRKDKVAAEINAHRATAKAEEISSALADRIALQKANKTPAPSRPGGLPAAIPKQPPRGARRLSEAEVKAVADRAEARSRR
jgi:hypothetical protein